jgi:hypothetical protein
LTSPAGSLKSPWPGQAQRLQPPLWSPPAPPWRQRQRPFPLTFVPAPWHRPTREQRFQVGLRRLLGNPGCLFGFASFALLGVEPRRPFLGFRSPCLCRLPLGIGNGEDCSESCPRLRRDSRACSRSSRSSWTTRSWATLRRPAKLRLPNRLFQCAGEAGDFRIFRGTVGVRPVHCVFQARDLGVGASSSSWTWSARATASTAFSCSTCWRSWSRASRSESSLSLARPTAVVQTSWAASASRVADGGGRGVADRLSRRRPGPGGDAPLLHALGDGGVAAAPELLRGPPRDVGWAARRHDLIGGCRKLVSRDGHTKHLCCM